MVKSSKRISTVHSYRELHGIDGEPTEFKWNISQDLRHWRFSKRSGKTCKIETLNLRNSKIESSACQCSMISYGQRKEILNKQCISNSEEVKNYAKRFSRGHWTFIGPADEENWYGTLKCTLEGKWDSTATQMVERFRESSHPIFKSTSALRRRILKRKNNRDTIHFNADASNTDLLFRTIHSANHVSIYGAVSSWCEEFGLNPNERDDLRDMYDEMKK